MSVGGGSAAPPQSEEQARGESDRPRGCKATGKRPGVIRRGHFRQAKVAPWYTSRAALLAGAPLRVAPRRRAPRVPPVRLLAYVWRLDHALTETARHIFGDKVGCVALRRRANEVLGADARFGGEAAREPLRR